MIANSTNTLLEDVEYKYDETAFGVWRRFAYPDGKLFEEFRSHTSLGELPLVHLTRGKCPETGKLVVAKGVVGIGKIAMGLIAIGQMSFGLLAIGQLGIGILFGLGQATTGAIAIGQLAVGGLIGIGQFATGVFAIGQFALGVFYFGQFGIGFQAIDLRTVVFQFQNLLQRLLRM